MFKNNFTVIHHLSLIILLAIGLSLFYLYRGFPRTQVIVSVIIAFLYFCWGMVYHYQKGDLHARIVLEYSLIAILAVILIRGAVLR